MRQSFVNSEDKYRLVKLIIHNFLSYVLSLSPGLDQHVPSYAGNEGEKLVKSMFRFSSNVLSTIAETFVAYCETKLSSQFQIKDQTGKLPSTQFSILCEIFQKTIY